MVLSNIKLCSFVNFFHAVRAPVLIQWASAHPIKRHKNEVIVCRCVDLSFFQTKMRFLPQIKCFDNIFFQVVSEVGDGIPNGKRVMCEWRYGWNK